MDGRPLDSYRSCIILQNRDDAIDLSWPIIISIQANSLHTCDETILSDLFVLTSAERTSFLNIIENTTMVAGIHGPSEEGGVC